MEVTINGQSTECPTSLTIAQLLEIIAEKNSLSPFSHVVVALNETVVPHQQLSKTLVRHGDRIEIVRAVGGG